MTRRHVTWLVLCLSLIGCIGATSNQSPSPTAEGPVATATAAAPSSAAAPPSTAASGGTTIVLNQAPANMGCDTIGIDYKSVTFDIDPDAMEQVSAETDTA